MKVYTCPKCGNKMKDVAPNFCPNCGCQSTEFSLTDVEETEVKETEQVENNSSEPKKKGCSFLGCIGIGFLVVVVGFVVLLLVDSGSGNSNNTSTMSKSNEEILAKECFVDDCIKKNMHNPKSYKEENYNVYYDYKEDEYIVTVMFRGNNAFGQPVLSTYKGGVKFIDDNHYRCRIISE